MSEPTPRRRPKALGATKGSAATARPAAPSPAPAPKPAPKPAGPPPALRADGLTKDYGDIRALHPLDLEIAQGETLALVGHNGSGKTTFLRMVAGLLEPTDGRVEVCGAQAGSTAARAALSYLSDTPTFYEDLSVWEHLEYTARLHGKTDWEQQAADLLGLLGLYDRADDLPVSFSRGLKQKASLAIGLIRPFSVLLVDEPFVGLDASGKQALLELFDEARAEGATLLVATHELEFVHRVERVLALRNGELVHDGPAGGVDVLELVT